MTSPNSTSPVPIASPVLLMGSGAEAVFCTSIVSVRLGQPGLGGFAPDAVGRWSCLPVCARRGGPTARRGVRH